MNIDVLFIAGVALVALGFFLRRMIKSGVIRQILAIAMSFGVFVALSHTVVPYIMTKAALSVSIGPDVITGAIFGLVGIGMRAQAKRGSMSAFAPIYMTIGVFVIMLNLVMPYLTNISDWSTTLPI